MSLRTFLITAALCSLYCFNFLVRAQPENPLQVVQPLNSGGEGHKVVLFNTELYQDYQLNNAESFITGAYFGNPSLPQFGINYNGGKVLSGTPTVHVIWYGAWTSPTNQREMSIIKNGLYDLSRSKWMLINADYSLSRRVLINGRFNLGRNIGLYRNYLSELMDEDILTILRREVPNPDPNGLYLFIPTPDIQVEDHCDYYCSWYSYYTSFAPFGFHSRSSTWNYAFIGHTLGCPACQAQAIGPNGSGGADGILNLIAYNLGAMITNPYFDAWFDNNGLPNTGKCSWSFGETTMARNGANYNMKFGSRQYLIQQNWVNRAVGGRYGYCAKNPSEIPLIP